MRHNAAKDFTHRGMVVTRATNAMPGMGPKLAAAYALWAGWKLMEASPELMMFYLWLLMPHSLMMPSI